MGSSPTARALAFEAKYEGSIPSSSANQTLGVIMKFVWKITGGRPMIFEGLSIRHPVTGKEINYYKDRLGRRWLASSPWSINRRRSQK